jgi:hypothetical protein
VSEPDPRILQPGDPGYDAAGAAPRITKPRSAAKAAREAIRRNPRVDRAYRTGVKVVGGTTVGLGVVLMPLPGPGTLIALGGLAILGTESERAMRLNQQGVALAKRAAASARAAREKRAARAGRKDAPQA